MILELEILCAQFDVHVFVERRATVHLMAIHAQTSRAMDEISGMAASANKRLAQSRRWWKFNESQGG